MIYCEFHERKFVMKKFSKILLTTLVFALLATVFALAVSADDGEPGASFVVAGEEYMTFEAAKLAADNKATIYLTSDVSLDNTVVLKEAGTKLKLDLNGHTLKINHNNTAFNVSAGASLTIQGSGTIANAPAILVDGSGDGTVVNIDGTGDGIVIDCRAFNDTSINVSTFRVYNDATLNVSGGITVNTNGTSSTRVLFNVSKSKTGGKLNVANAMVVYTKPTVSGCPSGIMLDLTGSKTNIVNSHFEVTYGILFKANGGNYVLGGDYIGSTGGSNRYWLDEEKVKTDVVISDKIVTELSADRLTFISKLDGYSTKFPEYSVASVTGAIKADFKNSTIIAGKRFLYGNPNSTFLDNGTNTSQFSFYNCDIVNAGEGTGHSNTFATYGPNVKIIGGSLVNIGNIAGGQPNFVELNDKHSDGTNAWVGNYVDNVLMIGTNLPTSTFAGDWDNVYTINPAAEAVSGRVTRTIYGKNYEFSTGYFSDMELYLSYNPAISDDKVGKYETYKNDCNDLEQAGVIGGEIANPIASFFVKPATGESSVVIEENGNGYFKWFISKNATNAEKNTDHYVLGGTNQSYGIAVNGSSKSYTNMLGVGTFVYEFDVKTDNGAYPNINSNFQTQMNIPLFSSTGASLVAAKPGSTAGTYVAGGNNYFQPGAIRINSKTVYGFGEEKKLPLDGSWARLTYIIDIDRSLVLEDVTIPSYKLDSDGKTYVADGGTVTKQAYKVNSLNYHLYVNGEYVGTNSYVVGTKLNSMDVLAQFCYILDTDGDGTDDSAYVVPDKNLQCYLKLIRMPNANKGSTDVSMCIDNVRTLHILVGDEKVDVGLYDKDGAPVKSLVGNEFFLTMPDNNNFVGGGGEEEIPVGAKVDGTVYETAEEIIAAIKDGSYVELLSDFESLLTIDNASFFVKTNGFNFPGIVSSTHKVSDYSGTLGGYAVTPAGTDDFYTLKYLDEENGVDLEAVAPVGTHVPLDGYVTLPGEEIAQNGFFSSVTNWTLIDGGSTVKAFYADKDGKITLTAAYTITPYFYEINSDGEISYGLVEGAPEFSAVLASALEKSGSVSVVLWSDLELGESFTVKTLLNFDLNGNSVTALAEDSVFKLLSGAELNVYSSKADSKAILSASALLVSLDAGEENTAFTLGNGMNNLSVELFELFKLEETDDVPVGTEINYAEAKLSLNGVGISSFGEALVTVLESGLALELYGSDLSCGELAVTASGAYVKAEAFGSFVSAKALVISENAESSFSCENTYLYTSLMASGSAKCTLGTKTYLKTAPETVPSALLAPGCIAAYMQADENGFVTFIDYAENLAILSWYDAKGMLIGTTYNAPFGEPVALYGKDEVGLAVGTEWYDVGFDAWDYTEWNSLATKEGAALDVMPVCKTKAASVKCLKINLVSYTYFELNFYLPKNVSGEGLEGFKLLGIYRESGEGTLGDSRYYLDENGKWFTLVDSGAGATIEDREYISYTVKPGAADAGIYTYKIVFEVEGELLAFEFEYGVPRYAFDAMSSENFDYSAKTIVMNMVNYANACYKLHNVGVSVIYENLLKEYGNMLYSFDGESFTDGEGNVIEKLERQSNLSKLGSYMSGASFVFGSYQPKFIFKYNDKTVENLVVPDENGKINKWPVGNRGVFTHIYYEGYNGTESFSYIAPQLAYDAKGNPIESVYDEDGGKWTWDTVEGGAYYATTDNMSVRDLVSPINIAVYGPDGKVVRGTYSLADYIFYLSATEHGGFYDAAVALYAFSLASTR